MPDENTPLRASLRINDDEYPLAQHSVCREIVGGLVVLLILFPILLVLCIIITPVLIYWLIQILCKYDKKGVNNGQPSEHSPRVDEEPDPTIHIGSVKVLFIIPDGGYDPAEVAIMYHTLKSYKKYENDEIKIIFATPSGAINDLHMERIPDPNADASDENENLNLNIDSTSLEIFAYGCDPLFKSSFGFGLFYSPYIDTYYRDMIESVDWYNSKYKNHPSKESKEIISFNEIVTDDMTEMYDGIYIAGGHHKNYRKLFKNRILHYKLSKLWQISLENQSGMKDPIQFAAIGRGVAILAYALYTNRDSNDDQKQNDLDDVRISKAGIGFHDPYGRNANNGNSSDEEEQKEELEVREASMYNSESDSDDDIDYDDQEVSRANTLPSQSQSRTLAPDNASGHTGSRGSHSTVKKIKKIKRKAKNLKNKNKFKSANLRSILYHISVTTLPAWAEFLGNLIAIIQYGQIFSRCSPHMQSCAEIVEKAVGDLEETLSMQAVKKFYHKGPENWLIWFFQSTYEYCTKGDFRLTYVVEDSHIVTGRWFIDAHLVAKRFMAKMVED